MNCNFKRFYWEAVFRMQNFSTYHVILNFMFSLLRKIFEMKSVNSNCVFSCNYECPLSKQNNIK